MPDKIRVNAKAFSGCSDDQSDASNGSDVVVIPEDFKGVVQINLQGQKEHESVSVANNTNVALTAIQNQLTQVQVGMQNLQGQLAELLAQQNQLPLTVMALLGGVADPTERHALIMEVAKALRPQSPQP